MSPEVILVIVIVVLLILLFSGMRIAFVLLAVGFIGLFFLLSPPQPVVAGTQMWNYAFSYVLTTIPLYVFMAEILMRSGLTTEAYASIRALLGRLRGAEAYGTMVLCAVFAALSGSSVANAAAIGTVAYPEMKRREYADKLSLGMIAAGGTLGILIPPSATMIIYGSLTGESVGKLFIGGIVPGLILTGLFLLVIFFWSVIRPSDFPASEGAREISTKEKLRASALLFPAMIIIIIVLGGLYAGIFTPTEAGGAGAAAALVIELARRRLSWSILVEAAKGTIKTTCMIMLIILSASLLTYVLGFSGVTGYIVKAVATSGMGYWALNIAILVFYLIAGCFIESVSLIVLTVPVMYPMMVALGLSPLWFCILLVVYVEMGLVTPPVGLNLFVIQSIAGERSFRKVSIGVIPFVGAMIIMALLLIAYPWLATWLPATMK